MIVRKLPVQSSFASVRFRQLKRKLFAQLEWSEKFKAYLVRKRGFGYYVKVFPANLPKIPWVQKVLGFQRDQALLWHRDNRADQQGLDHPEMSVARDDISAEVLSR